MSETKQQPTRTAPDLAALDAETIARELDWATAANGIRTLRDHGESAAADALALLAAQREAYSREVERLRRIINNVAVDLNDESYPLGHRIERASSHLLECPEAVFGDFPHGPDAAAKAAE